MDNRASKKLHDFELTAKEVFNSDRGRKLLAYLKEDLVDQSALRDRPELTYYMLGQKELVQTFMQYLDNKDLNIDKMLKDDPVKVIIDSEVDDE